MPSAAIRSIRDEDLQYRRQVVRVRGKAAVATPAKSVDLARLPSGAKLGDNASHINEMRAAATKKSLSAGAGGENSAGRRLGRLQRRLHSMSLGLQLCFVEYREPSLPTRKEIGIMAGLAHSYSDMVPIPMLSKFAERASSVSVKGGKRALTPSSERLKRVTRCIASSIESIEQLGGKPVMGYVPDYRICFGELVKLYADRGINAFYFDAHGASPVALAGSLGTLAGELDRNGVLEQSLVHMINPGRWRNSSGGPTVPARDVLGFGLGIDSLGEAHAPAGRGPGATERGVRPGGRLRLFDKNAYGYVRAADQGELERFYPDDSSTDRSAFLPGARPDSRVCNAFNAEQLCLESARLRDMIGSSDPLSGYLSGKAGVSEADIKILKGARVR